MLILITDKIHQKGLKTLKTRSAFVHIFHTFLIFDLTFEVLVYPQPSVPVLFQRNSRFNCCISSYKATVKLTRTSVRTFACPFIHFNMTRLTSLFRKEFLKSVQALKGP